MALVVIVDRYRGVSSCLVSIVSLLVLIESEVAVLALVYEEAYMLRLLLSCIFDAWAERQYASSAYIDRYVLNRRADGLCLSSA